MTLSKDQIGALVFLCLSLTYGYYAGQITMLPGDEFEPFHARTLPTALAGLGILFSFLLLVTGTLAADRKECRVVLSGYDFVLVEGFKNESYPKILLIHDKDSLELLSLTAISAVMVWEPMRNSVNMIIPSGIPQYEINDIEGIVRLIDK